MKRETKKKHKINSEVRFPKVRLIGRGDPQIISSYDASKIAQSEGLDLILINESQDPPIVKIEVYNKFLFNLEKAEKEKKKNAAKSVTKEIQLSPGISDHDLETKARKGKEFLEDNNKVKVVLQLKGRQKGSPERGEIVMLKFFQLVEEVGVAEALPKLEASRWLMMIKPRRKV
jgi:translation initiation factor IF-3